MESSVTSANAIAARRLLLAGAVAGPIYIVVGLTQVLTREGFDVRLHPLSVLSNGDLGWIQIGNFLLAGVLVLAGAIGVRRLLRGGRGGTWGPILFGLYGVGLVGSGIFVADPGAGFPPGTPTDTSGMSQSGMLHFVFGAGAFYALIAACFVMTRYFAGEGRTGWAWWSFVTGLGFLGAFAGIATGAGSSATMLAFYAAVFLIWIWHSAVHATLLHRMPTGSGVVDETPGAA